VSAPTDLSDNKIGGSTGVQPILVVFSWPFSLNLPFFIPNQSLSLEETLTNSLDLEVPSEVFSFFQNLLDYRPYRIAPFCSLRESLKFVPWCSVQCEPLAVCLCLACENP
jgi:hypothetical protein